MIAVLVCTLLSLAVGGISVGCSPSPTPQPIDGNNDADANGGERDASEPDASDPDASEPDVGDLDASEPDASDPDASGPDVGDPDAGEPDADAGSPDAGNPDASDSGEEVPDTGPTPTDCSTGRQPPAGWTQVSTCRNNSGADCADLGAIFGGSGNIEDVHTGNIRNLVLNRNSDKEYWAMEFNTTGLDAAASFRFEVAESQGSISAYGNGRKAITISECPGDFNKSAIPQGCYVEGLNNFLILGNFTIGGPTSTAQCELDADKTYYFNVLYTDSAPGTSPDSLQPSTCGDGKPGCGNQWVIY